VSINNTRNERRTYGIASNAVAYDCGGVSATGCFVPVQDDRNGREQVSVGVVEVSEVVAHELGPCLLWKERATTVCPRAQKTSLSPVLRHTGTALLENIVTVSAKARCSKSNAMTRTAAHEVILVEYTRHGSWMIASQKRPEASDMSVICALIRDLNSGQPHLNTTSIQELLR